MHDFSEVTKRGQDRSLDQNQRRKERTMDYKNIILDVHDHVAYIILNRPQAMNSLSIGLLRELSSALSELELNPEVLGVILTGNGKAFCAGADLTGDDVVSVAENQLENTRDKIHWIHGVFNQLENFPRPVIAAINGYALGGGCEISMCCDIRIASESAILGQPEVGLGVIACYGGPQRLPRLVGAGKAKELLYTAKKIGALEAKEIGLVNYVVPHEGLMKAAEEMMHSILVNAPISVKYTKTCVNRGLELPLDYALELEIDMVSLCMGTGDAVEGTQAFREKRKPIFKNR